MWEHRQAGKHRVIPCDISVDQSGYTPQALDDLTLLARLLNYKDASRLAARLGIHISDSQLREVVAPVAETTRQLVHEQLETLAEQPLECVPAVHKRTFAIQTDGVIVLGRKTGKNVVNTQLPQETGEAIEIKTATIFRQEAPSDRLTVAEACSADDFLPLLAGMLRAAGVRQDDELIGVSDGAVWIEERFQCLGVTHHVLDVFHAAAYLDTLLVEMNWSAQQREDERQAWLSGQRDASTWLTAYISAPVEQKFSEDAQRALRYLRQRRHMMAYPTYKARGWPIGSGQIEGVNKSVIGDRMKGSGMHWSRSGATGMAALRANGDNRVPLIPFDAIRHQAYPIPA